MARFHLPVIRTPMRRSSGVESFMMNPWEELPEMPSVLVKPTTSFLPGMVWLGLLEARRLNWTLRKQIAANNIMTTKTKAMAAMKTTLRKFVGSLNLDEFVRALSLVSKIFGLSNSLEVKTWKFNRSLVPRALVEYMDTMYPVAGLRPTALNSGAKSRVWLWTKAWVWAFRISRVKFWNKEIDEWGFACIFRSTFFLWWQWDGTPWIDTIASICVWKLGAGFECIFKSFRVRLVSRDHQANHDRKAKPNRIKKGNLGHEARNIGT